MASSAQKRRTIVVEPNIPEQRAIKLRGLGVFAQDNTVYLYFLSKNNNKNAFSVATSANGLDFQLLKKDIVIARDGTQEQAENCSDFQVIKTQKDYFLFYKHTKEVTSSLYKATSNDLCTWQYAGTLPVIGVTGIVVPNYFYQQQSVMYVGDKMIYLGLSDDLTKWTFSKNPLLSPRVGYFDNGSIEVAYVTTNEKGILVIYHVKIQENKKLIYKVGAALFDKQDPTKLLWRSDKPFWDQQAQWQGKKIAPLGVAEVNGRVISYWTIENEVIYAVVYALHENGDGVQAKNVNSSVEKAQHNPILSPKSENEWEAFNTFNPAALYEDGKVHLIYRAQGYNYVSVLGYATSSDGVTVDERFDEPVYIPAEPFEYTGALKPTSISHMYMSGGGYGGCEDPRLTKIDDKIYMTYVAFDGWNPPRVALTSIRLEDFLNRRWLWEKPVLISPPGIVNKNAVIFPEKINGKYCIMHRVYPDILIDFVDTLAFDGTSWLEGHSRIQPRKDKWDSKKIGAGAPPIKTKDGWLLIYQAVGFQEGGKYKIGAMLLDLKDPTKVLHRSNSPIIEPNEWYENEGFKAGVVYPCGAVVIKDRLYVYYGGADSYVCVATANLDKFLRDLQYDEITRLEKPVVRQVMHHDSFAAI